MAYAPYLARQQDDVVSDALQKWCGARMETMRGYRLPWWAHWAALAEMYLPRRYRWFVTPNNYNRGSPINQAIVDETGMLAARTLATGLLSGLTSPTKPWFRLGLQGISDIPEGPAKAWLADCTQRMLDVYAKSNFYQSLGTAYHDMAVFGSAAQIQYEDSEDVIRFYNPCLGEFFFGLSNRLEVDTLYREYTYTVSEAVKEFGMENLSESTQNMAKSAASQDTEIVIGHAIEPNTEIFEAGESRGWPVLRSFKYRECYWESTSNAGTTRQGFLIRCNGFKERPFVGLRWDVTSNDPYGRSPGMDALPAVRQLQIEQRRKAEAIDKMVRPPMVASVSMKNEPMDILPGGVSFVADPSGAGFKPAFTVEPRIAEMMEDLKEVQDRVNKVFFVDLFLMISNLGTVRTATEIDARREEKLILLGPVIERTENEGLDDIIERTFAIMSRRKLFAPPPAELSGAPITVEYISLLAEAQRAASTAAIERVLQLVGGLVAVKPDAIDNLDTDALIDHYADLLNLPPNLLRASAQVIDIRAKRAEAQQQAAALQTGAAAAQGAQTLSQTDVGGGQNALQMVLGKAA
jgi:Bacteriophage head to tail connecting protein